MNWLTARLSERTSQAAIAGGLMLLANTGSDMAAWSSLTPWLHLMPALITCLITVLIPEGLSPPAPALPPAALPVPAIFSAGAGGQFGSVYDPRGVPGSIPSGGRPPASGLDGTSTAGNPTANLSTTT